MVFAVLALTAVQAVADESLEPVFDLTPDEGQVTDVTMPQTAPTATKIASKPVLKKDERKPASVKTAKKSPGKSLRGPASNRFLSDESRNILEAEAAAKGAKIQDEDLNLAQAMLKNAETTHQCVHKEIEKATSVGAKYRVVFQCGNKVRSRVYFRIHKKKLLFSAVQLRFNKAEDDAAGQQEAAPQTSTPQAPEQN